MNLPNKLTILRVLMIPVFLFILLGPFEGPWVRPAAAALFVLASLTDWLDGYIARKQGLVTNFGKFADPIADKLLVVAALIAFVELGDIPGWIVVLLIAREFLINGFRLIAVEQGIVLAAGFSGKLKTATQMVMIIYVLLASGLAFPGARVIQWILIGLSVVFSLYSAAEYILRNKNVLKEAA